MRLVERYPADIEIIASLELKRCGEMRRERERGGGEGRRAKERFYSHFSVVKIYVGRAHRSFTRFALYQR